MSDVVTFIDMTFKDVLAQCWKFLKELLDLRLPAADRQRCVNERTRCKNALRGMLRILGIETPKGLALWSGKGLAWLEELTLPDEAALQRDQLVGDVRHHSGKIKRVDAELAKAADRHAGVALLRTIPGVGARTAEAFLAYIDEPDRFGKCKSIGRYLGLVPSQDASGGVNRMGRITREGPATVRKLLTEAAWQGVLRSPTIRAYYGG